MIIRKSNVCSQYTNVTYGFGITVIVKHNLSSIAQQQQSI